MRISIPTLHIGTGYGDASSAADSFLLAAREHLIEVFLIGVIKALFSMRQIAFPRQRKTPLPAMPIESALPRLFRTSVFED